MKLRNTIKMENSKKREEVPFFSNKKGEWLSIIDLSAKKIKSICFVVGQQRFVLNDLSGIFLDFKIGKIPAIAFFSSKDEYKKIYHQKLNVNNFWVVDSKNSSHPYQLFFNLPNLIEIDWE